MSTYLISYPTDSWPFGYTGIDPDFVPNPIPAYSNIIKSGQYSDGVGDRDLFLCDDDMSVGYPTDARVIGGWNNDGSTIVPVHADYSIIRPMGNDSGLATDDLNLHHWVGHEQRHMQETPAVATAPEYPADNQPYKIKMERTYILDDGFPHIPWGFRLTIEFVDPNRAPDARSIGVYSDEACTSYLWTPGAFVWTDTGEVDGDSQPIYKWVVDCPIGQRTAERTDWHVANLFGAGQEGYYTLLADQDEFTRHFWEGDQ